MFHLIFQDKQLICLNLIIFVINNYKIDAGNFNSNHKTLDELYEDVHQMKLDIVILII